MAVAELVTAEQYLHSSFEHDAEFVEGRIVERPVPTWEHASMQGFLIETLRVIGRRLGLFAVPEHLHERTRQLSLDRCFLFRIPALPKAGGLDEDAPNSQVLAELNALAFGT